MNKLKLLKEKVKYFINCKKKYRVAVVYFVSEHDSDTEYVKDFFFKFKAIRFVKKNKDKLVDEADKKLYESIYIDIEYWKNNYSDIKVWNISTIVENNRG